MSAMSHMHQVCLSHLGTDPVVAVPARGARHRARPFRFNRTHTAQCRRFPARWPSHLFFRRKLTILLRLIR